MEYLATIVFERTPAGAVAIKAAGDALPRQLRTLLLAIDGRSPVSQYVPFLTALAPLSEKFAQLEVMGFARRRDQPPEPSPTVADLASLPAATALTGSDLQALARSLSSTVQAPAPTESHADDFEAQLQAFAQEQARLVQAGALAVPAPSEHTKPPPAVSQRLPQLADALADMQAYLSRAVGLEGLPVALMLEQITSLGQLRQELPSYEALLVSYGGDPAAHIHSLKRLLDQADG